MSGEIPRKTQDKLNDHIKYISLMNHQTLVSGHMFTSSGLNNMQDVENLRQLNKLIADRENNFQHALSDAADSHLLHHLKSDIDFLREKRDALNRQLSDSE